MSCTVPAIWPSVYVMYDDYKQMKILSEDLTDPGSPATGSEYTKMACRASSRAFPESGNLG